MARFLLLAITISCLFGLILAKRGRGHGRANYNPVGSDGSESGSGYKQDNAIEKDFPTYSTQSQKDVGKKHSNSKYEHKYDDKQLPQSKYTSDKKNKKLPEVPTYGTQSQKDAGKKHSNSKHEYKYDEKQLPQSKSTFDKKNKKLPDVPTYNTLSQKDVGKTHTNSKYSYAEKQLPQSISEASDKRTKKLPDVPIYNTVSQKDVGKKHSNHKYGYDEKQLQSVPTTFDKKNKKLPDYHTKSQQDAGIKHQNHKSEYMYGEKHPVHPEIISLTSEKKHGHHGSQEDHKKNHASQASKKDVVKNEFYNKYQDKLPGHEERSKVVVAMKPPDDYKISPSVLGTTDKKGHVAQEILIQPASKNHGSGKGSNHKHEHSKNEKQEEEDLLEALSGKSHLIAPTVFPKSTIIETVTSLKGTSPSAPPTITMKLPPSSKQSLPLTSKSTSESITSTTKSPSTRSSTTQSSTNAPQTTTTTTTAPTTNIPPSSTSTTTTRSPSTESTTPSKSPSTSQSTTNPPQTSMASSSTAAPTTKLQSSSTSTSSTTTLPPTTTSTKAPTPSELPTTTTQSTTEAPTTSITPSSTTVLTTTLAPSESTTSTRASTPSEPPSSTTTNAPPTSITSSATAAATTNLPPSSTSTTTLPPTQSESSTSTTTNAPQSSVTSSPTAAPTTNLPSSSTSTSTTTLPPTQSELSTNAPQTPVTSSSTAVPTTNVPPSTTPTSATKSVPLTNGLPSLTPGSPQSSSTTKSSGISPTTSTSEVPKSSTTTSTSLNIESTISLAASKRKGTELPLIAPESLLEKLPSIKETEEKLEVDEEHLEQLEEEEGKVELQLNLIKEENEAGKAANKIDKSVRDKEKKLEAKIDKLEEEQEKVKEELSMDKKIEELEDLIDSEIKHNGDILETPSQKETQKSDIKPVIATSSETGVEEGLKPNLPVLENDKQDKNIKLTQELKESPDEKEEKKSETEVKLPEMVESMKKQEQLMQNIMAEQEKIREEIKAESKQSLHQQAISSKSLVDDGEKINGTKDIVKVLPEESAQNQEASVAGVKSGVNLSVNETKSSNLTHNAINSTIDKNHQGSKPLENNSEANRSVINTEKENKAIKTGNKTSVDSSDAESKKVLEQILEKENELDAEIKELSSTEKNNKDNEGLSSKPKNITATIATVPEGQSDNLQKENENKIDEKQEVEKEETPTIEVKSEHKDALISVPKGNITQTAPGENIEPEKEILHQILKEEKMLEKEIEQSLNHTSEVTKQGSINKDIFDAIQKQVDKAIASNMNTSHKNINNGTKIKLDESTGDHQEKILLQEILQKEEQLVGRAESGEIAANLVKEEASLKNLIEDLEIVATESTMKISNGNDKTNEVRKTDEKDGTLLLGNGEEKPINKIPKQVVMKENNSSVQANSSETSTEQLPQKKLNILEQILKEEKVLETKIDKTLEKSNKSSPTEDIPAKENEVTIKVSPSDNPVGDTGKPIFLTDYMPTDRLTPKIRDTLNNMLGISWTRDEEELKRQIKEKENKVDKTLQQTTENSEIGKNDNGPKKNLIKAILEAEKQSEVSSQSGAAPEKQSREETSLNNLITALEVVAAESEVKATPTEDIQAKENDKSTIKITPSDSPVGDIGEAVFLTDQLSKSGSLTKPSDRFPAKIRDELHQISGTPFMQDKKELMKQIKEEEGKFEADFKKDEQIKLQSLEVKALDNVFHELESVVESTRCIKENEAGYKGSENQDLKTNDTKLEKLVQEINEEKKIQNEQETVLTKLVNELEGETNLNENNDLIEAGEFISPLSSEKVELKNEINELNQEISEEKLVQEEQDASIEKLVKEITDEIISKDNHDSGLKGNSADEKPEDINSPTSNKQEKLEGKVEELENQVDQEIIEKKVLNEAQATLLKELVRDVKDDIISRDTLESVKKQKLEDVIELEHQLDQDVSEKNVLQEVQANSIDNLVDEMKDEISKESHDPNKHPAEEKQTDVKSPTLAELASQKENPEKSEKETQRELVDQAITANLLNKNQNLNLPEENPASNQDSIFVGKDEELKHKLAQVVPGELVDHLLKTILSNKNKNKNLPEEKPASNQDSKFVGQDEELKHKLAQVVPRELVDQTLKTILSNKNKNKNLPEEKPASNQDSKFVGKDEELKHKLAQVVPGELVDHVLKTILSNKNKNKNLPEEKPASNQDSKFVGQDEELKHKLAQVVPRELVDQILKTILSNKNKNKNLLEEKSASNQDSKFVGKDEELKHKLAQVVPGELVDQTLKTILSNKNKNKNLPEEKSASNQDSKFVEKVEELEHELAQEINEKKKNNQDQEASLKNLVVEVKNDIISQDTVDLEKKEQLKENVTELENQLDQDIIENVAQANVTSLEKLMGEVKDVVTSGNNNHSEIKGKSVDIIKSLTGQVKLVSKIEGLERQLDQDINEKKMVQQSQDASLKKLMIEVEDNEKSFGNSTNSNNDVTEGADSSILDTVGKTGENELVKIVKLAGKLQKQNKKEIKQETLLKNLLHNVGDVIKSKEVQPATTPGNKEKSDTKKEIQTNATDSSKNADLENQIEEVEKVIQRRIKEERQHDVRQQKNLKNVLSEIEAVAVLNSGGTSPRIPKIKVPKARIRRNVQSKDGKTHIENEITTIKKQLELQIEQQQKNEAKQESLINMIENKLKDVISPRKNLMPKLNKDQDLDLDLKNLKEQPSGTHIVQVNYNNPVAVKLDDVQASNDQMPTNEQKEGHLKSNNEKSVPANEQKDGHLKSNNEKSVPNQMDMSAKKIMKSEGKISQDDKNLAEKSSGTHIVQMNYNNPVAVEPEDTKDTTKKVPNKKLIDRNSEPVSKLVGYQSQQTHEKGPVNINLINNVNPSLESVTVPDQPRPTVKIAKSQENKIKNTNVADQTRLAKGGIHTASKSPDISTIKIKNLAENNLEPFRKFRISLHGSGDINYVRFVTEEGDAGKNHWQVESQFSDKVPVQSIIVPFESHHLEIRKVLGEDNTFEVSILTTSGEDNLSKRNVKKVENISGHVPAKIGSELNINPLMSKALYQHITKIASNDQEVTLISGEEEGQIPPQRNNTKQRTNNLPTATADQATSVTGISSTPTATSVQSVQTNAVTGISSTPTSTSVQSVQTNAMTGIARTPTANPLSESSWTEWSQWSQCTHTCGNDGLRQRKRHCLETEESACTEVDQETSPCTNQTACVNYEWMAWGQWSDCSVTCGMGSIIRTRGCLTDKLEHRCIGDHEETHACQSELCPVTTTAFPSHPMPGQSSSIELPGTWSRWSSWGHCSVTCGLGVQTRFRSCVHQSINSDTSHDLDTPDNILVHDLSEVNDEDGFGDFNSDNVEDLQDVEDLIVRRRRSPSEEQVPVHCVGFRSTARHCLRDTCDTAHEDPVLVVPEGSSAKLYCGNENLRPGEAVHWYTPDGVQVKAGDNRHTMQGHYLYILHSEDYDRGKYRCVIASKDTVGGAETWDAALVVLTCATDTPCQNQGDCKEVPGSIQKPYNYFECRCNWQSSGDTCQNGMSSTIIALISAILIISLILAAIIGCIIFRKVETMPVHPVIEKQIIYKSPPLYTNQPFYQSIKQHRDDNGDDGNPPVPPMVDDNSGSGDPSSPYHGYLNNGEVNELHSKSTQPNSNNEGVVPRNSSHSSVGPRKSTSQPRYSQHNLDSKKSVSFPSLPQQKSVSFPKVSQMGSDKVAQMESGMQSNDIECHNELSNSMYHQIATHPRDPTVITNQPSLNHNIMSHPSLSHAQEPRTSSYQIVSDPRDPTVIMRHPSLSHAQEPRTPNYEIASESRDPTVIMRHPSLSHAQDARSSVHNQMGSNNSTGIMTHPSLNHVRDQQSLRLPQEPELIVDSEAQNSESQTNNESQSSHDEDRGHSEDSSGSSPQFSYHTDSTPRMDREKAYETGSQQILKMSTESDPIMELQRSTYAARSDQKRDDVTTSDGTYNSGDDSGKVKMEDTPGILITDHISDNSSAPSPRRNNRVSLYRQRKESGMIGKDSGQSPLQDNSFSQLSGWDTPWETDTETDGRKSTPLSGNGTGRMLKEPPMTFAQTSTTGIDEAQLRFNTPPTPPPLPPAAKEAPKTAAETQTHPSGLEVKHLQTNLREAIRLPPTPPENRISTQLMRAFNRRSILQDGNESQNNSLTGRPSREGLPVIDESTTADEYCSSNSSSPKSDFDDQDLIAFDDSDWETLQMETDDGEQSVMSSVDFMFEQAEADIDRSFQTAIRRICKK